MRSAPSAASVPCMTLQEACAPPLARATVPQTLPQLRLHSAELSARVAAAEARVKAVGAQQAAAAKETACQAKLLER